jgi:hypothetical protein
MSNTKARLTKLEKQSGATTDLDKPLEIVFASGAVMHTTGRELDQMFREIAQIEKGRRLPVYTAPAEGTL